MKKILKITLLLIVFFLSFPLLKNPAWAAYLKFDKTTVSVANGGTFQIAVMVEPGSDSLNGVDAYITYDSTILTVTTVATGSLFPQVFHDESTAGREYIAGTTSDPASPVSAAGTLATITFQASAAGTGTVSLAYDCNTSKIIKDDINATNVISCSQNGTASVIVGSCAPSTPGGTVPTNCVAQPTSPPPTQLPQTGIFENVVKFITPGVILLILGGAFRLLL